MKPTKEFAACENCDAAIDTTDKDPKRPRIFIEKGTMTIPASMLEARKAAELQPEPDGAGNIAIDGHYCGPACVKEHLLKQTGAKKREPRKGGKKKAAKKGGGSKGRMARDTPPPAAPQSETPATQT